MNTELSHRPGIAPPLDAAPPRGQRALRALARAAEGYALLGVVVLLILFFTFLPATSDTFPTVANLRVTLGNSAVVAIAALAAIIPLICGQLDLSVGAMLGMASVFAAAAMAAGAPLALGVLAGLGVGAAAGVVNGLLVTRARIDSIIVTLGMSIVLAGVVSWKTDGQSIVEGIPEALISIGGGTWLGVPRTLFVLAAVAVAVAYVLGHTPIGRQMYALGDNETAARLVGLRTRGLILLGFVLAGVLAGVAGVLQVARAGGADPAVGENFTLTALAAAFLSAASIKPGRYNVGGCLVAVLFLAVLNSGLNLAGAAVYVNDFVNGIALIAGVGLAGLAGRLRWAR